MKLFILLTVLLVGISGYSQNPNQLINNYNTNNATYANKSVNYLLGAYIGNYISSVEIPSTRSVYAVIDESDKSLSLGFVVNDLWRPKDYNFHRWQAQLSLKSKGNGKDNFYTFRKDDSFVKSIGFEVTNTINFRGWLKGNQGFRNQVSAYRNNELRNNINDEINKGTLTRDARKINNKIAELESKNIVQSGLYTSLKKIWINTRIYIPVSPVEYEVTRSSDSVSVEKYDFDNWSASASGNFFIQGSKFGSHLFTLKAGILNNNFILNDSISSKDFYTLSSINSGVPVLGEKNSYYVGEYNEFISMNIGASWSSLFLFNNSLGLAARVEANIDEFNSVINWTLGIPFALRGKDSDNPVSFEVQYKEINKTRLFGISAGFAFGEKK